MIVSITRLELRSIWKLIPFMTQSGKVERQAQAADGNRFVALGSEGLRIFYTLTAWDTEDHMMSFMRSGAHGEAMKKSVRIAKSILSHHYETDTIPKWKEAKSILKEASEKK